MNFDSPDIIDELATAAPSVMDSADFGVVRMKKDGVVDHYNALESRMAGLSAEKVVGRHFFTAVAPCTNNFMIAQRFELEDNLDETIDYVFTLRMRPTKVQLRMLKSPDQDHQFLLVKRV